MSQIASPPLLLVALIATAGCTHRQSIPDLVRQRRTIEACHLRQECLAQNDDGRQCRRLGLSIEDDTWVSMAITRWAVQESKVSLNLRPLDQEDLRRHLRSDLRERHPQRAVTFAVDLDTSRSISRVVARRLDLRGLPRTRPGSLEEYVVALGGPRPPFEMLQRHASSSIPFAFHLLTGGILLVPHILMLALDSGPPPVEANPDSELAPHPAPIKNREEWEDLPLVQAAAKLRDPWFQHRDEGILILPGKVTTLTKGYLVDPRPEPLTSGYHRATRLRFQPRAAALTPEGHLLTASSNGELVLQAQPHDARGRLCSHCSVLPGGLLADEEGRAIIISSDGIYEAPLPRPGRSTFGPSTQVVDFDTNASRTVFVPGRVVVAWVHMVKVFDSSSWETVLTRQLDTRLESVAISADGRTLALSDSEGRVFAVDVSTSETRPLIEGDEVSRFLEFSPDGQRLFAAAHCRAPLNPIAPANCRARELDLATGEEVSSWQTPWLLQDVAYLPSGELLVASPRGAFTLSPESTDIAPFDDGSDEAPLSVTLLHSGDVLCFGYGDHGAECLARGEAPPDLPSASHGSIDVFFSLLLDIRRGDLSCRVTPTLRFSAQGETFEEAFSVFQERGPIPLIDGL